MPSSEPQLVDHVLAVIALVIGAVIMIGGIALIGLWVIRWLIDA